MSSKIQVDSNGGNANPSICDQKRKKLRTGERNSSNFWEIKSLRRGGGREGMHCGGQKRGGYGRRDRRWFCVEVLRESSTFWVHPSSYSKRCRKPNGASSSPSPQRLRKERGEEEGGNSSRKGLTWPGLLNPLSQWPWVTSKTVKCRRVQERVYLLKWNT